MLAEPLDDALPEWLVRRWRRITCKLLQALEGLRWPAANLIAASVASSERFTMATGSAEEPRVLSAQDYPQLYVTGYSHFCDDDQDGDNERAKAWSPLPCGQVAQRRTAQ